MMMSLVVVSVRGEVSAGTISISSQITIPETQVSTKPNSNGRSRIRWFQFQPSKSKTADEEEKDGKSDKETTKKHRPFTFGGRKTNKKDEIDSPSTESEKEKVAKKQQRGKKSKQPKEKDASDRKDIKDDGTPSNVSNDKEKKGGFLSRFGGRKSKKEEDGTQEAETKKEDGGPTDSDSTKKNEETGDGDSETKESTSSPSQNTTTATTANASNTTAPDQQQQQSGGLPGQQIIVLGGPSTSGSMMGRVGRPQMSPYRGGPQFMQMQGGIPGQHPQQQQPSGSTVIATELLSSVLSMVVRLKFITWLARRLQTEEESIQPTQHFVWECVNDKYTRDATALSNAIAKPPANVQNPSSSSSPSNLLDSNNDSNNNQVGGAVGALPFGMGSKASGWFTRHAWNQHVRTLEKARQAKLQEETPAPYSNKTVVVVDCHPTRGGSEDKGGGEFDLKYLTNVVSFLLHQYHAHVLGDDPEIILLVASPGGAVTTYGLAASQIQRLTLAGIKTTACVDKIAASGGYMVASQATKILAAPFAALGSIGVIAETLNFHQFLTKHGIKPLTLKAGVSKNALSQFADVTQDELDEEKKRLEQVHEEFIDLCFKKRPQLERSVCDGRVLTGVQALEVGMVDGISTSDDYIWEQIQNGHRVLMVHKSHAGMHPRRKLISAIDLLPHLLNDIRAPSLNSLLSWQNRAAQWVTGLVSDRHKMEQLVQRIIQAGCFVSMFGPKILTFLGKGNGSDYGDGNY